MKIICVVYMLFLSSKKVLKERIGNKSIKKKIPTLKTSSCALCWFYTCDVPYQEDIVPVISSSQFCISIRLLLECVNAKGRFVLWDTAEERKLVLLLLSLLASTYFLWNYTTHLCALYGWYH